MKAIKIKGAVDHQRPFSLNSQFRIRRHRQGFHRAVWRIIIVTIAIAFSGLLITSAFAQNTKIESASIRVDGAPQFEVAADAFKTTAEKVANLEKLDDWLVIQEHSISTGFKSQEEDPIVSPNDHESLTVTAQADDLGGHDPPASQDLEQAPASSLWQAGVKALGIALAALVGHWLTGRLWRQSLRNLLRRITFSHDRPQEQTSIALKLFFKITLVLMRLALWGGAAIYITNLFPITQKLSASVIEALNTTLFKPNFTLGQKEFSILGLLLLSGLLLGLVIGAGTLTNFLRSRILRVTPINRGAQEAVATLTKYSLISIGTIVILQVWGLDLSSLTLLASALGIGIGLGLQNIAKDFGSGLVLVFERSIQVGEFVEFGDFRGTVERIGARSTEIRTLDQISIIVPNSRFLEQEVINWSHRNPLSRIRLPVGVDYQSEPETVKLALLEAAQTNGDILSDPPPQVLFTGFGDSALEFELLVWITEPSKQPQIKSNLNFAIQACLNKHNIEIPFPQRDVNLVTGRLPIDLSPDAIAVLTKLLKTSLNNK
ncbi:MAG: mechanosensitive ion channel [Leptolyngbyaceae cyanobacterium MO_188.B28]|nr:mechanosensitive ion channel [Leptolyngbyaceae cyanobacterium MO_188.B28]